MARKYAVMAGVVGAFAVGAVAPAVAATSFSGWVQVPGTYSNRCAYVRTHVDNTTYSAYATVKSVTNAGGCSSDNAPQTVVAGYLKIAAYLTNVGSNTLCAYSLVQNNSTVTSLEASATNLGGAGCSLTAGKPYQASGEASVLKESTNEWYGATALSGLLHFN